MPHTSHLAPLAAAAAVPRPAAASAATAAGAMTNSVAAPATRTTSRRLVSTLKSRLAASLLVPCRRPTSTIKINSSRAVRPATSSAYLTAGPAALPPPPPPPSVQAQERVSSLAAPAITVPAGNDAVRWTWPTAVLADRADVVDGSAEGNHANNNGTVYAHALRTSSSAPCAEDCASTIGPSVAPPPPHRSRASPSATAPAIAHHWPLPSSMLHPPPPPPPQPDHDPIPSLLLVSPRQLRSLDSALRAEVEQLVVPLTATAPALASDDAPAPAHGMATTRRHPRFERIHADDRADPEALADRLALLWAKFTSDMLLRNYTASPNALVVSLYSLAMSATRTSTTRAPRTRPFSTLIRATTSTSTTTRRRTPRHRCVRAPATRSGPRQPCSRTRRGRRARRRDRQRRGTRQPRRCTRSCATRPSRPNCWGLTRRSPRSRRSCRHSTCSRTTLRACARRCLQSCSTCRISPSCALSSLVRATLCHACCCTRRVPESTTWPPMRRPWPRPTQRGPSRASRRVQSNDSPSSCVPKSRPASPICGAFSRGPDWPCLQTRRCTT
ncbi:hypothetical protein AMAG_00204 [Allomyces macrogynus ATCC 38327]|uniref:Uncharacterized protein n=1 Tax=Allomyces macrogynus (strain ATCC 38327) TaxID=578462 RepID=A0A0L0RV72_ALLM3|nr:hypothetical protein AMAG_00204 [Allomyces macrogynus ATCC 38327]|eukprot:KNE54213.1 hypothetical protein AMAG_00204 [Allomyces macrogynus ATCC 38327]